MKSKERLLMMFLISGLIFLLCGSVSAQSIQTKLNHLYATISKIDVSKDNGATWLIAFEGEQTQDLVAISGENALIFKPRVGLLKEAIYNKARTTVTYAKAEITLDDGVHGPKQHVFDNPAVINKVYPIIDERSIRVTIKVENGYALPSATFKFYAEKSYVIKAAWDPKINNYKVTDIQFNPIISVK
jgi:hypothetical protein